MTSYPGIGHGQDILDYLRPCRQCPVPTGENSGRIYPSITSIKGTGLPCINNAKSGILVVVELRHDPSNNGRLDS
jgi:hypothetical protein